MLVSGLIFSVCEGTAKLRGDAQDSEVVRRYSGRAKRLGPARRSGLTGCVRTLGRQADGAIVVCGSQIRKHVICVAPRKVVWNGNGIEVRLKALHWVDA